MLSEATKQTINDARAESVKTVFDLAVIELADALDASRKTLRDEFAMRAPAKQLWAFEPVMPAPTPQIVNLPGGRYTHETKPPTHAETEKQRYSQWPWAYADALLAAREREVSHG